MDRVARSLVAALVASAVSFGAVAADDDAARRATSGAATAKEAAKIGRTAQPRSDDTVSIFNRPIVTFRSPFLGMLPSERAAAAHARIMSVLDRGGPGAVSIEKLESGDALKIDGTLAFGLTRDDVDRLGGETYESLERSTMQRLEQAIAETREARSTRLMLVAALWAIGATVVYLLLLRIMSPHYLGDPAQEKVVPKARWYASPATPPHART